jgi:hypothetical protein
VIWPRPGNLTLMPASQLPFRDEWLRVAGSLDVGSVLFVVPVEETSLKRNMMKVARAVRGRRVAAAHPSTRHVGAGNPHGVRRGSDDRPAQ